MFAFLSGKHGGVPIMTDMRDVNTNEESSKDLHLLGASLAGAVFPPQAYDTFLWITFFL